MGDEKTNNSHKRSDTTITTHQKGGMMYCNHCKKEEETMTIGGKTYCTNCSNVLSENKNIDDTPPKHKMPKLEPDSVGIRTSSSHETLQKISEEAKEIEKDINLSAKTPDELGSSAILLDILSETAKGNLDKKTIEKDKSLEEASGKVLDTIIQSQKLPAPEKETAKQYLEDNHPKEGSLFEKNEKPAAVLNESGYTKEYDMLIILSGFVVIMITLAILMFVFKQYI